MYLIRSMNNDLKARNKSEKYFIHILDCEILFKYLRDLCEMTYLYIIKHLLLSIYTSNVTNIIVLIGCLLQY